MDGSQPLPLSNLPPSRSGQKSCAGSTITAIRNGTITDLPRLIELGERMRRESAVYYPPIDIPHLTERAEIVFSQPDKFCCFVAENGNNIVGWLNGFESGYIFNPIRVAAHDVFYIVPEARSYGTAMGLVRAFIEWAESLGIRRQMIRLDTGLRPEKVERFYLRLGFKPIGGQYLRDS